MDEELQKRSSDFERAAGVLLITADNKLVLQLRDEKQGINFPGMVGAFGGGVEENELPIEAAVREMDEETNLGLTAVDIKPFITYKTKQYGGADLILCIFIAYNINLDGMEVYEGQGTYILSDPNDPLLIPNTKKAVERWFNHG